MTATGAHTQIFEFAEFRIDAARRQLLRAGEPLPLTPKVFDTLLHLVRHSDRVVEKEELMRSLWPDTIVEENNLTQNISHLRRILGQTQNGDRYIATIPGRGYRFVVDVRAHDTPRIAATVRTIAVLPFKPLVAEDRDEALELGMADTLIARLSGTRGTVVRPLSSVRRYSALDQDALAAGREMGVQSVLDGSIQRNENQIRVTARLISVPDGVSLWAQTFEEEFTDVFAVQDTISERVAAALALRVSAEERKRLTPRYTENVEAYHCYLKGWYHIGKLTPPSIRKGIQFFRQAIDIDPLYALAYAGIADAYRRLPITSDLPPKEAFPKAKAAAMKALEIDDAMAEAHTTLGFLKFWFDRDWAGAEHEMRRGIELRPHSGYAHMAYTILLTSLGRFNEATQEGRQAVEHEPLTLIINATVGWALYCAGHDDEARARIDKTLELDPDFWVALSFSGRLYAKKGDYPEAVAAFTKARQISGGNSETIALLGHAYARAGDRAKALAVLAELQSQAAERYVPPHNIAVVYYSLDDKEEALRWLEKAYEDRDVRLAYLNVDPNWQSFRSDPRFAAFLTHVGFGY